MCLERPRSRAWKPGDIVLAVNGNPVKTVAELRAGIKGGGRAVALLIQRGEAQIFVPIPIEGSAR
jgi:serine protease Do